MFVKDNEILYESYDDINVFLNLNYEVEFSYLRKKSYKVRFVMNC